MPSGQESFTSLLDRATAELYAAGKIEEAIKEATNRLAEARRLAEEDDADPAMLPNALEVLAEFHREHGDFEKSESMYIEAIDLVDQKENSRQQRGRLHSGLGTLYDFNQREEQAVPHYEKAIEDFEALTPPRSNEAAQLRNNLAMIYKSLGRHPLAEPLLHGWFPGSGQRDAHGGAADPAGDFRPRPPRGRSEFLQPRHRLL